MVGALERAPCGGLPHGPEKGEGCERALPVVHPLGVQVVHFESELREFLVFCPGFSPVCVWVDGEPAPGEELPPDFDISGLEKLDEVVPDYVDHILMECTVVSESEEVELQGLALHDKLVWDVGDCDCGVVWLSSLRA